MWGWIYNAIYFTPNQAYYNFTFRSGTYWGDKKTGRF